MIPDISRQYVIEIAENTLVQQQILKAMFNGCEKGSDIYEHLYLTEDDIGEELVIKLYGCTTKMSEEMDDEDKDPEDHPDYNHDAVFHFPELATVLIETVYDFIDLTLSKS